MMQVTHLSSFSSRTVPPPMAEVSNSRKSTPSSSSSSSSSSVSPSGKKERRGSKKSGKEVGQDPNHGRPLPVVETVADVLTVRQGEGEVRVVKVVADHVEGGHPGDNDDQQHPSYHHRDDSEYHVVHRHPFEAERRRREGQWAEYMRRETVRRDFTVNRCPTPSRPTHPLTLSPSLSFSLSLSLSLSLSHTHTHTQTHTNTHTHKHAGERRSLHGQEGAGEPLPCRRAGRFGDGGAWPARDASGRLVRGRGARARPPGRFRREADSTT